MVTIIKPNSSLRICIDPHNLNKAIQQEHYPMQTIEEVTTQIPDTTYFSVLDARCKVPNSAHSIAHLVTICSSAFHLAYHPLKTYGVFQKVMTEMFEDIDGAEVVVDDILVWGTNEVEYDSRMIKVLDRDRLRNLKLNKAKCQFKKQEITYLGHVLTKDR